MLSVSVFSRPRMKFLVLQHFNIRIHQQVHIEVHIYIYFNFYLAQPPLPPVGQGLLIHEVFRSHTTTHHRQ